MPSEIFFTNTMSTLDLTSVSTTGRGAASSQQNTTPMENDSLNFEFLQQFDIYYAPIHAYLSAVISVMGVFCNTLLIIIMSRPDMRTPTNRLYAVMAFADLMTMLLYSIFAIFFQIIFPPAVLEYLTEWRAIVTAVYADLSVFVHTLSVMILIAVTVFRVLILQLPAGSSKQYCSLQRANLAAIITFILCIFITLPNVYITSWRETVEPPIYWEVYRREDEVSQSIATVNFWFQAIFVKLLPCLLLTLASIAIVRTLKEAEARRIRLQGKKNASISEGGSTKKGHNRSSDPRIRNRTLMLLALLVVFLLTEFPQGILTLVCGIMGDVIWNAIYMPLGNFLDMLTLLNAAVTFVLFVSMSSEFRLALNKQLSSWFPCYAKMIEKKNSTLSALNVTSNVAKRLQASRVTTSTAIGDDSAFERLPLAPRDTSTSDHQPSSTAIAHAATMVTANSEHGAISALILADLDNIVDGELVVKPAKVIDKRPSAVSRHSSNASIKKEVKMSSMNTLAV